jgi:branched-chain amino acid transport system ATP-binding protein
VIVAQAIDLAVAEGEALGIIGPNGAGKTTLFGIASGTVRPDAGRVIFAGSDITRLARPTPLPPRHRPLVQDSAAVQWHERVREPGCGGGVRRRAQRARRLSALRRTCSSNVAWPTRRTGRPGRLTLLDRKRLELARALATQPRLLLLDEVAGRPDRARMRGAGRSDPKHSSQRRLDHLDRACRACAHRGGRSLLVLHGGGFIGEGEPKTVIKSAAVREIYMGIPPMPEPLLDVRALDAFYGDFQALFGVSLSVAAGRGGRRHRRQWRREIDAAQLHRRRHPVAS